MKKVYTILSAIFVGLLLVVGITSLFSSDAEAQKPKLTFSGLLNGSFFAERRAYYAQTFPQSESLKSTNTMLNGFYKFSGLTGENDVSLIINANGNAADHGASLNTPQPSKPEDNDPGTDPSPSADEPTTPSSTDPTQPSSMVDEDAVVENLGAALLIGNRAVEVPYANYTSLDNYSAAVTGIANALGSSVRTFSIAVPNGAEFYTTEDYHTGDSSQINMIDYIYGKMGSNVHTVDAYSKLAAHIDEYIYFRTDHHWTATGAYYAYEAYCQSAGITPTPLSSYEKMTFGGFLGTLYSKTGQPAAMGGNPDSVEAYIPKGTNDEYIYDADGGDRTRYRGGVVRKDTDSFYQAAASKYNCFLMGDHPLIEIHNENISADRKGTTVLLVKESFGNAFAPFLVDSYEYVYVVDYRYYNGTLSELVTSKGVDDVIFLNNVVAATGGARLSEMEDFIG